MTCRRGPSRRGEQARATRLLDEIADLNREKLELDVPQEVLGIAGLAA